MPKASALRFHQSNGSRLEQSPPGAPEILTGCASQEGSRRLLRSQPRRLGFGQPRQARPRRSYANIPWGSGRSPSKPELSTWPGVGTFYLAPTDLPPFSLPVLSWKTAELHHTTLLPHCRKFWEFAGVQRGMHKGAEPSCGGSRACAAWGERSRPGFPWGNGKRDQIPCCRRRFPARSARRQTEAGEQTGGVALTMPGTPEQLLKNSVGVQ